MTGEYMPSVEVVGDTFAVAGITKRGEWDKEDYDHFHKARTTFFDWHAAEVRKAKTISAELVDEAVIQMLIERGMTEKTARDPYVRSSVGGKLYRRQTIAVLKAAGLIIADEDT